MKSLSEQMQNFDREQMRRVAHNLPEQYEDKSQVEQVAHVINGVFTQLLAAFPASLANRDQHEMNEIRRQWVMAFRENGITTMDQVNAGMRVARRQERPFLPSPGQFVAWCKAEEAAAVGLPDANELVDLIYQYCRGRGLYPDAESYPWPGMIGGKHTTQSSASYWMVTTLYANMRANSLSDSELRRKAADELAHMAMKINRGEAIPEPVKQLPVLGGKPLIQAQGLAKIAEIRAKFGLGGKH
ncbi:TPA: replication protein P [Salmonella enterica subsp. enterica serovar Nagoya]